MFEIGELSGLGVGLLFAELLKSREPISETVGLQLLSKPGLIFLRDVVLDRVLARQGKLLTLA